MPIYELARANARAHRDGAYGPSAAFQMLAQSLPKAVNDLSSTFARHSPRLAVGELAFVLEKTHILWPYVHGLAVVLNDSTIYFQHFAFMDDVVVHHPLYFEQVRARSVRVKNHFALFQVSFRNWLPVRLADCPRPRCTFFVLLGHRRASLSVRGKPRSTTPPHCSHSTFASAGASL